MVQSAEFVEVLKTLHDVFASVTLAQIFCALVLDTVSVREILTDKSQVGLNWHLKDERWKSTYPTLRREGCVCAVTR